jgi:hypothetical protein
VCNAEGCAVAYIIRCALSPGPLRDSLSGRSVCVCSECEPCKEVGEDCDKSIWPNGGCCKDCGAICPKGCVLR